MTPIPGALLILALPLAASVLAYLVRRWAVVAAAVSAATATALALLCLLLPLDRSAFVFGQEVAFGRPVVIVGRLLMLDTAGQTWLAFVFALAAVCFLLASRLPQGRLFFSVSLVILSLYALVALLQTFSLAILVFAMSATPAVFLMLGDSPGPVRGAQRYLLVTVLAVPLLVIAAWLVDQSLVDPTNAEMARLALLPAALGFGLLLAVFPFGTWIPAMAADAPPLVSAFVAAGGQAMAVFLVLTFLWRVPWPLGHAGALEVVQLVGLVTAISGGLMAAAQRDLGRLFGYAVLSDLGFLLIAFGVGGSQGMTLALLHAVNRSSSIVLMASALAAIRLRTATDTLSSLRGVARQLPVPTVGLLIGGLALAGMPVTAGFPTHWAIARAVAAEHWLWVLLLAASSAGIVLGVLRGLGAMLGTPGGEVPQDRPVVASMLILALCGLVIALGLFPQLALDPVRQAVEAFALF